MKKEIKEILILCASATVFFIVILGFQKSVFSPQIVKSEKGFNDTISEDRFSFYYTFNQSGVLEETVNMKNSPSQYWWLTSGGKMIIYENSGKTIYGDLAEDDAWRKIYAKSNPLDTQDGFRPQNLFRLITRRQWLNFSEEIIFSVKNSNLAASPNRNASNGFLLMLRYNDENNLYYAGIRVDGAAVIKKKVGGKYYTIGLKQWITESYDRNTNPNILPRNAWMGLRAEIRNTEQNQVSIKLFAKKSTSGWELVLETIDDGKSYGGKIIEKGYAGIRADFMDVEFKDFKIETLSGS